MNHVRRERDGVTTHTKTTTVRPAHTHIDDVLRHADVWNVDVVGAHVDVVDTGGRARRLRGAWRDARASAGSGADHASACEGRAALSSGGTVRPQ